MLCKSLCNRPRKFSDRDPKNPKLSVPKLTEHFATAAGQKDNSETVHRTFQLEGFNGRVTRIPLISPQNLQK